MIAPANTLPSDNRIELLLRGTRGALYLVLAIVSCFFISLFFFIALSRMNFPLQLEWVECGILDGAIRILHHQALYVRPTYQWVTDIYTPVFSYIGAVAVKLGGPSLRSLRLVSIASTAACLVTLFFQTRAIARSWFAGLLAAGLFAALYGAVDFWYDIGRVDMLCLFFTLLAVALSYRGHSVLAALTFVLAYQTKQGAALVAVFVLLHEIQRPKKLFLGIGTFFAALFLSIFCLNRQSSGWYSYYTLQLPAHQPLVPVEIVPFFTRGLFNHLGLAIAVVAIGLMYSAWREPGRRRLCFFLLATTIGTFASSLSGRVHSGGSVNAMLPLYAWICVLFGLGFTAATAPRAKTAPPALAMQTIVLLMSVMQLCQLLYPPEKVLPSKQANLYAQAAMSKIAAVHGDLYTLDNSVDVATIGKEPFANTVCIWDVVRGDHGPVTATMEQSIALALQQKRFAGIISHGDLPADTAGSPPTFSNYAAGTETILLDPAQVHEL